MSLFILSDRGAQSPKKKGKKSALFARILFLLRSDAPHSLTSSTGLLAAYTTVLCPRKVMELGDTGAQDAIEERKDQYTLALIRRAYACTVPTQNNDL